MKRPKFANPSLRTLLTLAASKLGIPVRESQVLSQILSEFLQEALLQHRRVRLGAVGTLVPAFEKARKRHIPGFEKPIEEPERLKVRFAATPKFRCRLREVPPKKLTPKPKKIQGPRK